MKIISGICGGLLVSGMALGWWLVGDFSGGAAGLFLAMCLALLIYWLGYIFIHRAARTDTSERARLSEIVYGWLNRGRKQA